MVTCCVPNCPSDSRKQTKMTNGVGFHRYPTGPLKILESWEAAINRPNWTANSYTRICSMHFKEECFYIGPKGVRKLLDDAIPSEFLSPFSPRCGNEILRRLEEWCFSPIFREWEQNNASLSPTHGVKDNHNRIMSRASFEQVNAIISYMEKHPTLAHGRSKSLESRFESRGQWQEVASILNAIKGARKTAKGWAKFWADKKCNVRRLATVHGNPDTGTPPPGFSPVDRKILSMVGFRDGGTSCMRSSYKKVKREKPSDDFDDEQSVDYDQMDKPIEFVDHPVENDEERHTAQMDKLFQVMTDQAAALTELAQASHTAALAMERLAESSQRQVSATERLADSVERIANALVARGSADVDTADQKVYGDIPR